MTFGALTAAIIAVFTIASGAIILIPTWLWSLGLISDIDPLMYKVVWWAMGHSSQQINVSAHVSLWYLTAALLVGAKPLSEKVSRMAFFMYILFLQLASAHHLLAEPGMIASWKIVNTSYMMYLAVMGSMVHGLTVPGAIEAAQRRNGFTKGAFEWLRKAPWGNPAFAGMFLSLVILRLHRRHLRRGAGHRAAQRADAQHDLCARSFPRHGGGRHDARLHGGDLSGAAAGLPARRSSGRSSRRSQPYLFGIGAAGISLFMMGAGTLGVARRHWDITFSDAASRSPTRPARS